MMNGSDIEERQEMGIDGSRGSAWRSKRSHSPHDWELVLT